LHNYEVKWNFTKTSMIIPELLEKLHQSCPKTIKTMNVRETDTPGILISSLIWIFRILIQTDHVWTVYINFTETSSDFFLLFVSNFADLY